MTKNHGIGHFTWVSFIVCKFHLHEAVRKNKSRTRQWKYLGDGADSVSRCPPEQPTSSRFARARRPAFLCALFPRHSIVKKENATKKTVNKTILTWVLIKLSPSSQSRFSNFPSRYSGGAFSPFPVAPSAKLACQSDGSPSSHPPCSSAPPCLRGPRSLHSGGVFHGIHTILEDTHVNRDRHRSHLILASRQSTHSHENFAHTSELLANHLICAFTGILSLWALQTRVLWGSNKGMQNGKKLQKPRTESLQRERSVHRRAGWGCDMCGKLLYHFTLLHFKYHSGFYMLQGKSTQK